MKIYYDVLYPGCMYFYVAFVCLEVFKSACGFALDEL